MAQVTTIRVLNLPKQPSDGAAKRNRIKTASAQLLVQSVGRAGKRQSVPRGSVFFATETADNARQPTYDENNARNRTDPAE